LVLFIFGAFYSDAYGQKRYHGDGVDDVLRFVPWAGLVGMRICDHSGGWPRFCVNTVSTVAITVGVTYSLKSVINDSRPDGTDNKAFPSGHTSFAFAGAHLLNKEYGKVSPWISVAGYTVATITAVDRLRRNRHELDDVIAGAAIGIGAAELGCLIGKKLMPEKNDLQVAFSPNMLHVSLRL